MKDNIEIAIFIAFIINIFVLYLFYSIHINCKKIKDLLFAIAFLEYKKANKEGEEIKLEEIYKKGKML